MPPSLGRDRVNNNNKELVKTYLISLHQLGANMSSKLLFLHSHPACFPKSLGDVSSELENTSIKISATWKLAIKVVGMPSCLQTTVGLSSAMMLEPPILENQRNVNLWLMMSMLSIFKTSSCNCE